MAIDKAAALVLTSVIAASVIAGIYFSTGLASTRSIVTTSTNDNYAISNSTSSQSVMSSTTSESTLKENGSSSTFNVSPNYTSPNENLVLTTNIAFAYDLIPSSFHIGNFTVEMVINGTGYESPPQNGTSLYLGYVFAFNVSTPDGRTANTFFNWQAPCSLNLGLPCTNSGFVLPNPENTTVNYLAANLRIVWYTNSTGLFVSFQEWDEIQNATTVTTIQNTSTTTISTYSEPSSIVVLNTTDGASACPSLMLDQSGTASWNSVTHTCTLSGSETVSPTFLVGVGAVLQIGMNVNLILGNVGYSFANYGIIDNNGTIWMLNDFVQYGILNNYFQIITNNSFVSVIDQNFLPGGGTINNYGYFEVDGYYTSNTITSNATAAGNVTEYLSGGNIANGAIINNYGRINSSGIIDNYESGLNFNSTINNYGSIYNENGQIQNNYFVANYGSIFNGGSFVNNGTLYQSCTGNFANTDGTYSGSFSGNPITTFACTTTNSS